MSWSRQGIVSEVGEPSGSPWILASPAEVDFVVPILNLVWAGSYGRGVLPTLSCRSSCGRVSFSLLRLCGHRVDGKRRWWMPQILAMGARRGPLASPEGFPPAVGLEMGGTAPQAQHRAVAARLEMRCAGRVLTNSSGQPVAAAGSDTRHSVEQCRISDGFLAASRRIAAGLGGCPSGPLSSTGYETVRVLLDAPMESTPYRSIFL